jgi:MFS family permease
MAAGLVAGLLYLAHARRAPHPILDPKMFRLPLFRNAVIGGSLFRIGIGAFPFLMPLMLQLGFGMTPFQSGLTTFIAAIGAIMSKFGAERLYQTFGFPRTLMVTAVLGCVFLAINALFVPSTPVWIIMVSLFLGGLTRSFFFTGNNALVFADVDEKHASQATAINSVSQQLSIATGVAVAGGTLELVSSFHGEQPTIADFHVAWIVVAAVAIASAIPFLRLPPDAGSDVSGHRMKPLPKPVDPAI